MKASSVFAVESNLQLRGNFVLVAEEKKERIKLIGGNIVTEREVIGHYFHCDYDFKAIVHFLKTYRDIFLSIKERLAKVQFKEKYDDPVLRTFMKRELETPSQCLGYKGMWHLLRKAYSIQEPRDRVM